jgi:hypothetical protein
MEKALFIYRCTRCCALFAVESLDETYGADKQAELLEANDCRVCNKGDVQFVGKIEGLKAK